MSRITKEEIEKTKCGRFLLSDENIYLSIYSLNSYVFEYNLLNTEDRILYHRLQDKFDARLINGVITRVREQIIELFDKDKYIEAKVYFKPKKLSENGELEFRPLHSTGLITQIAIVSMLHLFVYEIPEEEEGDPKLRLSNLSRLIPSDFYGNRVSVKPEYLFKPWKQQYQKYNQNSNDALMKYHTSLEYKYEVTLDLENFFPTINPIIIYRYIINHLPAYLNDEERKMMKRVLQKLLFCKLTTTFDEKTAGQYYKVTKGAGNYDNVDKIEQNEKECWAFKEKSDKFVRGIPQGLPQSYFLGNIYMISIAEIFRKKFTGVSYFYVDDSVIFTNDVREDNFKEQLKELNKQIADEANNFEDDSAIYPEGTEKFYKSDLYGVNVHLDGKSNYTRLDNLDDSEVYLKCISREMSQAGSDFFRMYSDEENRNLEEKLDVLSKQVKAKRDQLVEEKSQKRDSGNEDAIEKDEDDTQKFEKRLTRYYRFFEYRKQRLVAMHQPENGSDEDYKKELEKIIYSELSEEDMEDDEKILQAFMNSYGADIWDAAIGMYQTFADDKEQNVLKNYILKINELCYGKASVEFSYLECTYRDLLRNEEENDYSVEEDIFEETLKRYMTEEDLRDIYNDPYKTLKYLARVKLKRYANKHYEVAEDYSSKLLKKTDEEILKILLSENEKLPSRLRIVCASTQKIIRMVLNTVCSYLFNVEVSNHPVLAQNSKKALTYPVLLKKIGDKYNYIFIDEYQDTSSYVLDIFYDAVKNRENVQIYLFGDRMQQIYRNYDGSFEGKLKEFDTSDRLEVNFRSIGKIVSILNNIYNDSSFEQQPTESNANVVPDIEPHVIISSNVPESIYKLQNKFPKILVLYLMNKEKYEEIGAKNLYDAYRSMEEYTFGRKYSSTDVLSDMSNDNPDILMKFLFLLNNVIGLYIDKNYGMVISICKKENKYFDSSQFKIKKHADKKSIKNKFDKIIEIYEKDGCLIKEVIESLFDNGFIPEKVKNDFEENIEYQKVLDIEMKEVSNLANYLSMPHISTQHGVKGESHTSVIFVASDNVNTPNVRMYPFFELWSKLEFSLPQFEELFYSYSKIIEEVEKELGMKVSKLTAETHNKNEKNKTILNKYSKQVLEKYQENLLFEALCKEDFITYLKKPNVKNVKKIFKITEIEGILTAYKLFYVGCSRARKNLIIMVEKNKIINFKEKFVDKIKKIGFTVLS